MDKKKLLYILLAVLAASLVYRIFAATEEKRAPLKYKTGALSSELGVRSSELKDKKEETPRIELSRLASIKIKPPASGINIFSPFFIKEPPPKPPEPPKQPLPPPVDPLEEELKLFRFMGFLERGAADSRDKKIFLAKGQNVYIVKDGDTIEGKFMVSITGKAVEISGINSEKRIAIPIEEK